MMMNRTSNTSDMGYYDPTMLQRNELMGSRSSLNESPVQNPNIGEWFRASIMGDWSQVNFDYGGQDPSLNVRNPSERNSQADLQSQLLVYKTQQIAQSRSFDSDCSCSSYSSDVPHCTCDQVKSQQFKLSVEQESLSAMCARNNYKTSQDAWLQELAEQENYRIQKEKLFQSLAVPDPSLEYPYYTNYLEESSIYEQDPQQVLPLLNPIAETSPAFAAYHRVPPSQEHSVPSPITSPVPLKPTKSTRPRLCHFLIELLANPQQYSEIVEWVDKEKGVFKFLNSAEVASQWGRRRNKPHMKYENFARSLRTYIAKGILTKPRSKLVYRFTNKVY